MQRNALKLNRVREVSGLPVISHSRRRETIITIACQKRGVEVVRPIPRNAPSIGASLWFHSCCCWRYTSLFSVWSDIREIDAQPAMSDNGAEVVNLSAPQQWHTTLDLTAGPVTFRNGGSPLATTTVVVAELLGRERTTCCSCPSFFASGTEVLR